MNRDLPPRVIRGLELVLDNSVHIGDAAGLSPGVQDNQRAGSASLHMELLERKP
jgi:hypothetical protein